MPTDTAAPRERSRPGPSWRLMSYCCLAMSINVCLSGIEQTSIDRWRSRADQWTLEYLNAAFPRAGAQARRVRQCTSSKLWWNFSSGCLSPGVLQWLCMNGLEPTFRNCHRQPVVRDTILICSYKMLKLNYDCTETAKPGWLCVCAGGQ